MINPEKPTSSYYALLSCGQGERQQARLRWCVGRMVDLRAAKIAGIARSIPDAEVIGEVDVFVLDPAKSMPA